MLHTTFARLHDAGACIVGYRKLAQHLCGIKQYGRDTPIPLTVVLDSNGIEDALWCLRATIDPCERFARLHAVACVRRVEHLLADQRSRDALDVAERFARGLASDSERAAAWDAARDAAWDAARDAAWDAAEAATEDAARAAQGVLLREMLAAHESDDQYIDAALRGERAA